MSKSFKLKNNNYLDSTGIVHNCKGPYTRTTLDSYLPKWNIDGPLYSNSNYMQLGYISCSLDIGSHWSNLTLLIASCFYGAQHWSTHLLTVGQAQNVKANYIKIGGNDRGFYYKIDSTNYRIYIYAYVTGGNGFGYWTVQLLNRLCCLWTTEIKFNVTREDSWVAISATS